MKTLIPVLIFFLCNAVGSFVGPTVYGISLAFKIIDLDTSGYDSVILQSNMLMISMTWLVCALFSFSSFFLSGSWKAFYLAMPIILPFIVSLTLMSPYMFK